VADETYTCPYCGEPGEIDVDGETDPEASGDQVFVQDCAVCCRPATVTVRVDADGRVSMTVDA